MTATPPLSERRVLDLIDAYGATPERWPETERTAALGDAVTTIGVHALRL